MTIAVESQFTLLRSSPKKSFSGFQRDSIPWPVSSPCSALPAELWKPIHWRQTNLLSSSTRERNETQNEMMWTAGIFSCAACSMQLCWVIRLKTSLQIRILPYRIHCQLIFQKCHLVFSPPAGFQSIHLNHGCNLQTANLPRAERNYSTYRTREFFGPIGRDFLDFVDERKPRRRISKEMYGIR